MRVFLIHGLGRTPASMWLLGQRLGAAGHQPKLFGYWVTQNSLDEIASRLASEIRSTMAAEETLGDPYAVIGHSLGNIITRLASPLMPPGFSRFIMLAPPNHSPAIARVLKDNPLYRFGSGDTGQALAEPDFYENLPVPDVPSLIIAGTSGPTWSRFSPWEESNDIVVRVDEARLEGIPLLEVPAAHTFIMNRSDVTQTCLEFLEQGRLTPPAAKAATSD